MRPPRLPELALLAINLTCVPRHPHPTEGIRNYTHNALIGAIETPLSEVDQLIAEMETALKELQASPCEGPNGPRKARLKAAIKKAQDHLAGKNVARQEINLDCSPPMLGAIVELVKERLKETTRPTLAQTQ